MPAQQTDPKQIGQALQEFRTSVGIDMADLAKKMRLHKQAIYRIEWGQTRPTAKRIVAYVKAVQDLHQQRTQSFTEGRDLFVGLLKLDFAQEPVYLERLLQDLTPKN